MNKNNKLVKTQVPNKGIIGRTLFLAAVFGIVAFIVLAARLYKIQIKDHDEYESRAIEQQIKDTTVTASRGTIYDRNMKILAMSASANIIYISPAELIKYEEQDKASMIASFLADTLELNYDNIMKRWDRTDSWYEKLASKVDDDTAQKIRDFINENDLKSIHIDPDSKRYYPYSNLASQIIGFVGDENSGLEGIEAVYDSYLEGVNGRIIRATTEKGVDMPYTGYEDYYDAQDGDSLVLTVDSTVQYYLEKNLSQAVDDYQVKGGAMGVVMDVKTGAILGMTSLPDYDPNNYQKLDDDTLASIKAQGLEGQEYDDAVYSALLQQWRNRIISDTYEPGSTFKIITLAMGIESGMINENDTFYCSGSINVKGRDEPLHCWNRTGHGQQTLAQAAQHSCNVAFATIGLRMGEKKFYDYIEAFGFFDKTGIDLYGESNSLWWSRDTFENPDNYSQLAAASFGQTFNITPIQLITAVSAVANGGYLMKPYIVSEVLDSDGNVIKNNEPTVVRQVISEDTSKRVCAILESVVAAKEGTGKNAYVAGYRIAGKTGTSVDTTTEAATGEKKYKVSFMGIAPADDPQIAVLVILDSPSKDSGIYISGGVMAAPVVGKIMSDVLPYLGVQKEFNGEDDTSSNVKVPNVKETLVSEAKTTLTDLGFSVEIEGDGTTVTDQAPMANVSVAAGSKIILFAGENKPDSTVEVPDLNGMNFAKAKSTLQSVGLFIQCSGVAASDSSTIVVSGQGTSAGSSVAYGSIIQVTLIDTDSSIMESAG